jgi:hypothetical protein
VRLISQTLRTADRIDKAAASGFVYPFDSFIDTENRISRIPEISTRVQAVVGVVANGMMISNVRVEF